LKSIDLYCKLFVVEIVMQVVDKIGWFEFEIYLYFNL